MVKFKKQHQEDKLELFLKLDHLLYNQVRFIVPILHPPHYKWFRRRKYLILVDVGVPGTSSQVRVFGFLWERVEEGAEVE